MNHQTRVAICCAVSLMSWTAAWQFSLGITDGACRHGAWHDDTPGRGAGHDWNQAVTARSATHVVLILAA